MAKSTPKTKAWTAMSRYIRLRDALAYCQEHNIDTQQFARPEDIIGRCATCGAVKSWYRMHAGHFISRGLGGSSGVYFDERNVHLQCAGCNAFKQGAPSEFKIFMLDKYGQGVVDELERKRHIPPDFGALAMKATAQYYREKYKELLKLI